MITAGYELHLYCDEPGCERNRTGPDEHIGESWRDTAKAARDAGWLISRDKQGALCPKHSGKRKES